MIDVFELEKKISDNLFVVKFYELEEHFLIQPLPLRIWVLENYS